MMTDELLPCPFCGGKARVFELTWTDGLGVPHDFKHPYYRIVCQGGCRTLKGDYNTEAEAIAAWNTRSDYAVQAANERKAEQTVAATLGRPKVKKVRGLTYDEHGGDVYYLACSGCGEWIGGDLDCIGEADGPNFCGNCGGEFDGPLLCKRCGKLADMEFGDMCAECYWYEGEGNDER